MVSVPPGQLLTNHVLSKLPVRDEDTTTDLVDVMIWVGEDESVAVSATMNDWAEV